MITYAEAIRYFGNPAVLPDGYEENPSLEWTWGSGIWESDFMQTDGSMHPSVMCPGKQYWTGKGGPGEGWFDSDPTGYGCDLAGGAISEMYW